MNFKKDLLLTSVTSLFIATSSILLYKLALIVLGSNGFAEYSLSRRIIATAMPAMMIGLGVSVPRFVALYSQNRERRQFFTVAFLIMAAVGVFVLIIATALRRQLAYALLGDGDHASFIVPITFAMVGSALHAVCYGYHRGQLNMMTANGINVIGLVVIPVASMLLSGGSVKFMFFIQGILMIAVSMIVFVGSGGVRGFTSLPTLIRRAEEAIGYGVRRVPGDFALMALLGLPSTIAVHVAGLREAGMVAFCTTMVTMFGALFAPVSTLLLPYTALWSRVDGMESVKMQAATVAKYTLALSLGASVIVFASANWLIEVYLGPEFVEFSWMIRITVFGGLFYSVYVSLRSVNDAVFFRAVNAMACIKSLLLFCFMSSMALILEINVYGVLISLLVCLAALAVWTVANFFNAVAAREVEVG